jgi:uncharacterized protein YydD (DUF2326 family)
MVITKTQLHQINKFLQRVYITLPDKVHEQLEELVRKENRATANLGGYFVKKEIKTLQKT